MATPSLLVARSDAPSATAALVLFGTATFNAVLAVVNAHITPIPSMGVIGSEMLLIGAAHVLVLASFREEMRPWYALIWLMGLLFIFRTAASEEPDFKSLRDVLIIPTFVLLGMTIRWPMLLKVVIVIHATTLAFMLLEATATDKFASLFEIRDYYIQTRGYSVDDFWNTESDLFVSATRPDDRIFLPFLDLHRTSSIFLEPVSLGNYCVVITAFLCATYRRLSWPVFAFLTLGNLALLIGSDGRLAVVSSAVIVTAAVISPRLPRFAEVLYLPGILLLAFLAVWLGRWSAGSDDFPGRVATTVKLLNDYDVREFIGISRDFVGFAVDSGIAYLITTQSVLGLILLWGFIVFASRALTVEQVRYTHGLCIFIAFNLLISFSFVSIKTAALLWTIHGVLQAETPFRRLQALRVPGAVSPVRMMPT